MSVITCPQCGMVNAVPKTTTRAALVIDYNAPDCTGYEYFTEYACSNCFHHFARIMPSHSDASRVRIISDAATTYDRPMGFHFHSSSTGYDYSNKPRKIYNYVAMNRRKRTAKPSDIKKTVHNKTVTEDCCVTEISMEMGD